MSMRLIKLFVSVCLAVFGLSLCAQAQQALCSSVLGKITWTVIPAPNDPFGRVVGSVTGSLKGSSSAIIQELVPDPRTGIIQTKDLDIFVLGKQDVLIGNSNAVFTPIPGQPGDFQDQQTITITGGTGRLAGATGTLYILGRGYNLGSPSPVGDTYFTVDYYGQVCHPVAK
jgi:hypothetical protein